MRDLSSFIDGGSLPLHSDRERKEWQYVTAFFLIAEESEHFRSILEYHTFGLQDQ